MFLSDAFQIVATGVNVFCFSKGLRPYACGRYQLYAIVSFTRVHLPGDSNPVNQKWYFSKYAGISAGFSFFNGGSATYVSAPFVLQLNHPLNDHVTAFAAVSASPTFFSFNNAFTNPTAGKYYPGSYPPNTYNFGMNSRVEMGLMYINDARTFSISGSIGVERSSYPIFIQPKG